MEELMTILTASGTIVLFIIIATILTWIMFINMTMDISKIKKKLNRIEEIKLENNEIYIAILNEIRRGNDLKYSRVQAQQMESIELPRV